MANEHPFQQLFETLGRLPSAHAEAVNRSAYERLTGVLNVPLDTTGRCILLKAPRAGHGKTHLLSRVHHHLGTTHEFIPLHASSGSKIDAGTVIDDTLRRLLRQLPAAGGLCILDFVARQLFAFALQPLVGSGEVPCQDREGALSALRMRPVETFDFHHPNAVTAHWARENFEVLGHRLSLELAQRSGLPARAVGFWVDKMFRFASDPLVSSTRATNLTDHLHGEAGEEMERLGALLGLMTMLMRVVLVADDLEGFSTDESSALRLAAFLGALRQSVDRLDVVLSLNEDIWQSAFLPRLSEGLADRLSEVVIELEPLGELEMAELLNSRVPGLGQRVLENIENAATITHARGLIRAAGLAWLKASALDTAPLPPPIQAVEPKPEVAIPAAFVEPIHTQNSPFRQPASFPTIYESTPSDAEHLSAEMTDDSHNADLKNPVSPAFEASTAPETETPEPTRYPQPAAVIPESGFFADPTDALVEKFPENQERPELTQTPVLPDEPAGHTNLPSPAPPPPVFQADEEPFETVIPAVADTDRVDDLLRQFRERYGRGSL